MRPTIASIGEKSSSGVGAGGGGLAAGFVEASGVPGGGPASGEGPVAVGVDVALGSGEGAPPGSSAEEPQAAAMRPPTPSNTLRRDSTLMGRHLSLDRATRKPQPSGAPGLGRQPPAPRHPRVRSQSTQHDTPTIIPHVPAVPKKRRAFGAGRGMARLGMAGAIHSGKRKGSCQCV